jgi:hypothetical protein
MGKTALSRRPPHEPRGTSPIVWCFDATGIGDATRERLAAAYRAHGGTFSGRTVYAAIQRALRDVRRSLEERQPRIAHELTRREDALEYWLADRRSHAEAA